MRSVRAIPSVAATVLLLLALDARAGDATEPRRPLPEPLFTETVTDVDGDEPGEIEFEINGAEWRSRRGGYGTYQATIEAEMLITSRLGVRVEPYVSADRELGDAAYRHQAGVNVGLSWKLMRDFERDVYLQAEVSGRYPFDANALVEPGEPALPFAFDLRGGVRVSAFTLRSSIGGTAGGAADHAPVRGSLGLFTPFGDDRFGFFGVELDVDAARHAPAVIALNLVPSLIPAGLPLKIGFAIPWALGSADTAPSLGVFVRLWIESAREVEFGEGVRAK
ncbi:MAG: hypothetical protein ACHREM_21475 [Polyangiales bacterium]